MENRHGLAVNDCVTQATGPAEAQAAIAMVGQIPGWGRITLGGDKGYDRRELVQELREHHATSDFARKQSSIIDQRTTRHPGLRNQPAQAGQGDFRLAQDARRAAQDSPSRSGPSGLDLYLRPDSLQPGEDAQSGGCLVAPRATKVPKSSFRAIEKASDKPTNARSEPPHPD